MLKSRLLMTAVLMLTLSVRAAIAHSAGHGHREEAFGEPGDPAKPTRIVEITVREDGAKVLFAPEQVDVRRGEQIRFKIPTEGQSKCVLGTNAGIEDHAEAIKRDSELERDDPRSRNFAKFASGELLWRFTQTGQFAFGCVVTGHLDREIKGLIVVK